MEAYAIATMRNLPDPHPVYKLLQVIKNIRNVTRHRNGQSVKSRQTRWEWQLLIFIMHIHDVVTRYNICTFLCACASTGLYM